MVCRGYVRTLLEVLHEEILGILELHEVRKTLLKGLYEVLVVLVLCKVSESAK